MSPECPEKDSKPKSEWAIRWAKQHMQVQAENGRVTGADASQNNDTASAASARSSDVRWSDVQVNLFDETKTVHQLADEGKYHP